MYKSGRDKAIENIARFRQVAESTDKERLKRFLRQQILELQVRWGLPSPTVELDLDEMMAPRPLTKPLYRNGKEDKYLMLKNETTDDNQ